MLLSTTILPSLVVIVKGSVDIWIKLASSLRKNLDEELVVERCYRKTLFALRIHTPYAWNALICLLRF